jgi:hypothetical protein
MTNGAIPSPSSAIYRAALLIDKEGPQPLETLCKEVQLGSEESRQKKLDRAYEVDWLRKTAAGWIDITEFTKRYFERRRPKEEEGTPTLPAYRGDIFKSPGLSPKYIPNRRGPRADAPAIYGANPTFHRG